MFTHQFLIEREEEKRHLGAAINWITQQSLPHDIEQIDEASRRFNLSPLDEEFLIRQFNRPKSQ